MTREKELHHDHHRCEPESGVAKTTTAVSVAHGLAIRTGQPTLLLDLDQQGHDATALGMMAESCLFDFLVADAPLANCVRQTGRENLLLLPGNARTKHVDMIYRNEIDGFTKLCQRLRSLPFAFVVIDTPRRRAAAGGRHPRRRLD